MLVANFASLSAFVCYIEAWIKEEKKHTQINSWVVHGRKESQLQIHSIFEAGENASKNVFFPPYYLNNSDFFVLVLIQTRISAENQCNFLYATWLRKFQWHVKKNELFWSEIFLIMCDGVCVPRPFSALRRLNRIAVDDDNDRTFTWASEHNVEVQTINTDWWIVFDTQINMFLNTKAEISAGWEVVASQFVFADLNAMMCELQAAPNEHKNNENNEKINK